MPSVPKVRVALTAASSFRWETRVERWPRSATSKSTAPDHLRTAREMCTCKMALRATRVRSIASLEPASPWTPNVSASLVRVSYLWTFPFKEGAIFFFTQYFNVIVGTENGDLECYSQLNVRGSIQGNCGARDNQYVACEPENTQCGQLMCNGGGIFQRSQVPGLSPLVRTTGISSDSGRHTCASFTISPTADTISPGLVPDGTRCGNESV